ncbi:MAG: gamma-glutamyltransferase [Proteobacteria bacterium]|nr:gamma-glutamyltransferase [Pseudomonadota bacterium]
MHRFAPMACAAGLTCLVTILTACSSGSTLFGLKEEAGGGFVAGDEPSAVRVGQQVLAQGGTAADAATALYFALSVTYPVAAGLGGGGICIVHDPASGANEVFDFLPRTAAGGGAFAVPGNVRGFSVLQSIYGKFSWQRLIAPAEGLAAAGFPISRGLGTRLGTSQNVIRLDAELAVEFLDESGQLKPAGALVSNRNLASALAAIRERGPDGLYRGDIALKIANYAAAQSAVITERELADYNVNREPAHALELGDAVVNLPPMQLSAGTFAASLISLLADAQGNPVDDPVHAITGAVTQALGGMGVTSLPQDLGSTGFVAVDNNGQAVTCAVTMNAPFGTGRTVEATGVTMAKAPVSKQDGAAMMFLAPVIVADKSNSLVLAGSGAGGSNATAALAFVLLKLARGETVLGPGDLHSTGMAPYDTVNAVACGGGRCTALSDPGGFGLGLSAAIQ